MFWNIAILIEICSIFLHFTKGNPPEIEISIFHCLEDFIQISHWTNIRIID